MDDLLEIKVVCENVGVGVCLRERVMEVVELVIGEGFWRRASNAQAADGGDG